MITWWNAARCFGVLWLCVVAAGLIAQARRGRYRPPWYVRGRR